LGRFLGHCLGVAACGETMFALAAANR
jgi:hypothetical protein